MDDDGYKSQISYIELEYNRAYYRWVFCPDAEKKEAKRLLDIWRHKYFTF